MIDEFKTKDDEKSGWKTKRLIHTRGVFRTSTNI